MKKGYIKPHKPNVLHLNGSFQIAGNRTTWPHPWSLFQVSHPNPNFFLSPKVTVSRLLYQSLLWVFITVLSLKCAFWHTTVWSCLLKMYYVFWSIDDSFTFFFIIYLLKNLGHLTCGVSHSLNCWLKTHMQPIMFLCPLYFLQISSWIQRWDQTQVLFSHFSKTQEGIAYLAFSLSLCDLSSHWCVIPISICSLGCANSEILILSFILLLVRILL